MKPVVKVVMLICILLILNIFPKVNAEAGVIINEAMIDPNAVSDTYGEWVELYNDSNEAVDINGWIIKDLDSNYHVIDNGAPLSISPKGYLVLGRNADPALNGGYTPDYVYDSFVLANTVDEMVLEGAGLEGVMRVTYDASWPIEAGRSMAYSGTGDINNPANWFATPEEETYNYGTGDYGTPGTANHMPEPATMMLLGSGLVMVLGKKVKK